MVHWTDLLDDRARKHVAYARNYAENYAHGAPGHLDLMTIAQLAQLLDNLVGRTVEPSSLLTPAELPSKPIDLSKPPDVSKKPRGFA